MSKLLLKKTTLKTRNRRSWIHQEGRFLWLQWSALRDKNRIIVEDAVQCGPSTDLTMLSVFNTGVSCEGAFSAWLAIKVKDM
ncbi:AAEL011298-PA [Aedes aegypti]|uniref:AAEL011298-PA n=1 Tax=Aedes aegypti TaxID=7159 RepID=Q16QG5_AEDAE|nr:AAEL011298-PA [Aedes aegypti]